MKGNPFFRSPLFWGGLLILSLLSVVFLFFNFDKANPLVNVKVEMSRNEALGLSKELASIYHLGPESYKQAASFETDLTFQNYTELEGGGLSVFNKIIADDIYQPYQWVVRLFDEKNVNEVTFFFTPSGRPYGFSEKISDDLPGNNLSPDSALIVAKKSTEQWKFNLPVYNLTS